MQIIEIIIYMIMGVITIPMFLYLTGFILSSINVFLFILPVEFDNKQKFKTDNKDNLINSFQGLLITLSLIGILLIIIQYL